MLTQHYKILGVGYDSNADIKPAQWVFDSHESSVIVGFVLSVSHETSEFVLFEQGDSTARNVINLRSYLTPTEVALLLRQAIKANPSMQEYWDKIFQNIIKKTD